MQRAFHLQMLDLGGWLIAISLGLIPQLVNEFAKIFIRARDKACKCVNHIISFKNTVTLILPL